MTFRKVILILALCTLLLSSCNNSNNTNKNNKEISNNTIENTENKQNTKEMNDTSKNIDNSNKKIEPNSISETNLEIKNTENKSIVSNFEIKTIDYENDSKIDVILTGSDKNSKQIWEKKWSNVILTELFPYSEYVIHDENLYIEVAGKLFGLDINTGKELFTPLVVGVPDVPILDSDGNIYCSGYYGPLLTKISPEGKIIWQIKNIDNFYWPRTPYIEGKYVYIPFGLDNENSINLVQVDSDTGNVGNYYWKSKNLILWENIKTSSNLKNYNYNHLFDNNPKTAWVEGHSDEGIGEWIYLSNEKEKTISKIVIRNGYQKSKTLYTQNNRVKKLRIEISNKQIMDVELKDSMEPLEIIFNKPVNTTSLKITILSVYKGSKYNDTAISSIETY